MPRQSNNPVACGHFDNILLGHVLRDLRVHPMLERSNGIMRPMVGRAVLDN
jgi:hypothetical protein